MRAAPDRVCLLKRGRRFLSSHDTTPGDRNTSRRRIDDSIVHLPWPGCVSPEDGGGEPASTVDPAPLRRLIAADDGRGQLVYSSSGEAQRSLRIAVEPAEPSRGAGSQYSQLCRFDLRPCQWLALCGTRHYRWLQYLQYRDHSERLDLRLEGCQGDCAAEQGGR